MTAQERTVYQVKVKGLPGRGGHTSDPTHARNLQRVLKKAYPHREVRIIEKKGAFHEQ